MKDSGPAVLDDLGLVDPGAGLDHRDGVVEVSGLVNELDRQGLVGDEDAAVGQLQDLVLGEHLPAALLDDADEPLIGRLEQAVVDVGKLLVGRRPEGTGPVLLLSLGQEHRLDSQLVFEQVLEDEMGHDDADGPGDGRRLGNDLVAGDGGVVAAGGGHSLHEGHGRLALLVAIVHESRDRCGRWPRSCRRAS